MNQDGSFWTSVLFVLELILQIIGTKKKKKTKDLWVKNL